LSRVAGGSFERRLAEKPLFAADFSPTVGDFTNFQAVAANLLPLPLAVLEMQIK